MNIQDYWVTTMLTFYWTGYIYVYEHVSHNYIKMYIHTYVRPMHVLQRLLDDKSDILSHVL